MDINLYIESGAIESYVLGLTTPEEVAELELLMAQHPEIKQAVDDFGLSIEQYSVQNSIAPPQEIKYKVLSAVSDDFKDRETAPIIPIQSEQIISERPRKLWQYVAAASIILFIISALLNIYLYSNYQSTNNKYQALLIQQNSLQANNDIYRTKLNELQNSMQLMADTAMRVVKMKGVKGKENSLATVYWNVNTKEVYLLQNNLPQTPPDKQYQLWAIVDGKPVDAGMIGDCNGLCKMKNIPKAQAFAITLEKKGGSPTPTLSAMYVMGGT